MARSIYIASAEARSGRTIVTLGIMELLAGRGQRLGFFRPVIRSGPNRDSLIGLISDRYSLASPYEAMYGCTSEKAVELAKAGQYEQFLQLVLDKYKALERQCDMVVCVGTDYTGVATPFEFEFNVDLAKNLGAPIVAIVNGSQKRATDIVDGVRIVLELLASGGYDIVAAFVNRVAPDALDEVDAQLEQTVAGNVPTFVLPELPMLGHPTMGEIATALNAEWLNGQENAFNREVQGYKVAAMTLPNFLEGLQEGDIVITPEDRADIILGTLLSDASSNYPPVAGLVLTGELAPAPQIVRLLSGLASQPIPVIGVQTDTYRTAIEISGIGGSLCADSDRKIAAALGALEARVDAPELERRIAVTRPSRVTPLMFQYELLETAKKKRKHIVLPEGTEERILRASEILNLRGVVNLTLLGDTEEVKRQIDSLGLRLEGVNIVDPSRSPLREAYARRYHELRRHKGISEAMAFDIMEDVSYFGTMMVQQGDADGMVSGAVHTTQHTIRPAFEIVRTKPESTIVSSVFLMCMADRVLVFGDCAVNPNPGSEQLAAIAIDAADTAQVFGIEPRVALLSYSTGESGKGEAVDKVREATRIAKERRPDLKLEGPIQYDAAVDAGVASTKLPGSEVAGRATVLIFPDLNSGNNAYKAVQRSANALAIGPVLQGLNKPVNDLSRGCTIPDIVNTVAITAIQA